MTFRQSFTWWSFTLGRDADDPALLHVAADLGYEGVEMLPASLHDPAHDDALTLEVTAAIERAAAAGIESVIVFAGSRQGRDDAAGIDACARGLTPLVSRAADAGVTLLLEIGHVHTAGVPGRRDLDDRQAVNWPAIASLLRHLGYDRWVGHELIPRDDPVAALGQAHALFA